MIPDEAVLQIFNDAHNAWSDIDFSEHEPVTQLYRGISTRQWKNNPHIAGCDRHIAIFNQYNIIPKYCFDCYKISIKPRNVLELFKLMILFSSIELPNDNSRKCFVEIRPEVAGAYKGLIYCQGLEDAQQVIKLIKPIIAQHITKKIPLSLQHGCTEYNIAFPDFSYDPKTKKSGMTYPAEWKEMETDFDQGPGKDLPPESSESYNHTGFSLEDVLAMRTWVTYAATIGDRSYLKLTGAKIQPFPDLKRPPFKHKS